MEPEEAKPGCLMPVGWAIAAGIVACGGGGAVGFAGAGSESAGVSAAYMAAGPIGFALAGAMGAGVVHFASRNASVRAGVPVGCGCLGGVALFALTFVFFAAIFPAL